ncbi:MAG: hypothetical protein HQ582_24130 [Planctomycetes bacterium]|nr:hypothetical protein [Planctomycetota bacterium]
MPLAVTTGGRDRLVPADSALALAEAVKRHNPDVLIIHRPEVGHLTSYDDTKTALDFVIQKALDKDRCD